MHVDGRRQARSTSYTGAVSEYLDIALPVVAGLLVVIGGIVAIGTWREGQRAGAIAWSAMCALTLVAMLCGPGRIAGAGVIAGVCIAALGFFRRPDLRDD
jgi:hypothetical protein